MISEGNQATDPLRYASFISTRNYVHNINQLLQEKSELSILEISMKICKKKKFSMDFHTNPQKNLSLSNS